MKSIAGGLALFCLIFTFQAEARTKKKSSRAPASVETYQPTTEAQCTEIDLRGERCPDGSNRLPALRAQGMTNYCFAFSTTDLISYANCSHLSALSSGIIANLTDTGEPLKEPGNPINLGGSPRNLLEMLRRAGNGPCLESEFPSSPSVIMAQSKDEGVDDQRTRAYLMDFYNRRASANPFNCARQSVGNVRFNELMVPRNHNPTNLQLQQALKTALEVHHEPASMQVISESVMSNPEMGSERPDRVQTDHYITIVGRKWMNGHCHYLYRDQNPMRHSPWPRAEDHPQQASSPLPATDYFYIWMREENLLNNADDVIFNVNP